MALKKAKIISVTSVKGGTGKTIFTMNLAGMMAQNNLKVILVDLDLSGGTIAPSLNKQAEKDIYTLVDDLMNNRYEKIDKYIINYNDKIDILPAPNDPRTALKIHHQYMENIIRQLEYKYDIILVDTSHTTSSVNASVFDASEKIIYVITDNIMELKNLKSMMAIFQDMNLDNYKLVLNEPLGKHKKIYEIEDVLEKNIDYIIPKSAYIDNLEKYIFDGKIPSYGKGYKGRKTLEKIVKDILE